MSPECAHEVVRGAHSPCGRWLFHDGDQIAGFDLLCAVNYQALNCPGKGSLDGRFHFHGLDGGDQVAVGDVLSAGDMHRNGTVEWGCDVSVVTWVGFFAAGGN